MAPPRRPDPEPLRTNDLLVAAVGTALWAVTGLVLLLAFRPALERHHATWWLWACLTGMLLGFYGFGYLALRERRARR